MNDWMDIETQKDIDVLMESFSGFHDSCLVSMNYISGNKVQDNGSMTFGTPNDYQLNMIFDNQYGESVELCFQGVRRMHLVGLQDNYLADIFGASIAFYENIMPSKYTAPQRCIVWADDGSFDVSKIDHSLNEPAVTYIIAHTLKWRKIT